MAKKRQLKPVMIFGRKLRFIWDENLADYGLLGLFESPPFTVRLHPSLSGERLQNVVMHEITHAIMDRVGLHQAKISGDACEIIAEAFTNWISENFKLHFK